MLRLTTVPGCNCLLALALMLLATGSDGSARAEEAISPEFRQDIEKLLEITGAENIGLQVGNAVSSQVIDVLLKQNPGIPPEAVAVIKDEVSNCMKDEMPSLREDIVKIYSKYFTREDVQALVRFYETPLGKKSITLMPLIMNDSLAAGRRWGQAVTPVLGARLQKRLAAEGFGDRL